MAVSSTVAATCLSALPAPQNAVSARRSSAVTSRRAKQARWTSQRCPCTCSLNRGARSRSLGLAPQRSTSDSFSTRNSEQQQRGSPTQCEALPLGAVAVIANYSAAADRAILTARLIGFAIGALALSIALQDKEEDDDDIGGGGPGTGVPIPLYVRVDEDRPNYHRDIY